jgi:tRNA threonylcarbamoyladenosine biosynthesis protein TsaB
MQSRHDLSPTLLAIETSSDIGSVCVLTGGKFFLETSASNVKLSGWIIAAIDRVLQRANVRRTHLNAVAFGAGPGAFTGVRTACATAQTVAYALGLPLISVNSLHALAALVNDAQPNSTQITILIDARMDQLYCADYARGDDGVTRCTSEVELIPIDQYSPKYSDAVFVGSGVALWKNRATASGLMTTAVGGAMNTYPRNLEPHWAEGVAMVACDRFCSDSSAHVANSSNTDPLNAAPIYVRNNVAQTEVERALKRAST